MHKIVKAGAKGSEYVRMFLVPNVLQKMGEKKCGENIQCYRKEQTRRGPLVYPLSSNTDYSPY
jgi:hypothetical protein